MKFLPVKPFFEVLLYPLCVSTPFVIYFLMTLCESKAETNLVNENPRFEIAEKHKVYRNSNQYFYVYTLKDNVTGKEVIVKY